MYAEWSENIFHATKQKRYCSSIKATYVDNQAVFLILLREIYMQALIKLDESLAP